MNRYYGHFPLPEEDELGDPGHVLAWKVASVLAALVLALTFAWIVL